MNRSTVAPSAASAPTHPSSSSALSPCDGKTTGVPPRAVDRAAAADVRVEVEGVAAARPRRTRRRRSRPPVTSAVRSSTVLLVGVVEQLHVAGVHVHRRGRARRRRAVDVRLDRGPVDRTVGRVRQQHRRHAGDRTARTDASHDVVRVGSRRHGGTLSVGRRGGAPCASASGRSTRSPSASTSAATRASSAERDPRALPPSLLRGRWG